MNNYKQSLMQILNEYNAEERPKRAERRLLVIGLYLSYIACLATMWYIWNAPRQAFDAFWFSFAQSRFTLIILPILLLCIIYFCLSHTTVDIIGWGMKNLDERQKMVRDQAHRSAYKIIAFLCLFTPLYLIIQNMLTSPVNASIPGNVETIQLQTATGIRLLLSHPVSLAREQSLFIARNAILNQGIYYCLFLLILALIA